MSNNNNITLKVEESYFNMSAKKIIEHLLNDENIKENKLIYENLNNIKYIKQIDMHHNVYHLTYSVCFEVKNFYSLINYVKGYGVNLNRAYFILNTIEQLFPKEETVLFNDKNKAITDTLDITISNGLYGYILFNVDGSKFHSATNYMSFNYIKDYETSKEFEQLLFPMKSNFQENKVIEKYKNLDVNSKFKKEDILTLTKRFATQNPFLRNIYSQSLLCGGTGYISEIKDKNKIPLNEIQTRLKSFFTVNRFNFDISSCFLDKYSDTRFDNTPFRNLFSSHLIYFLIINSNDENLNFPTKEEKEIYLRLKKNWLQSSDLMAKIKISMEKLRRNIYLDDLTALVYLLNIDYEKISYFFNDYFENIDESLI